VNLERCTYELKAHIKVSRSKNSNGNRLSNNPCGSRMVGGFLPCWTLDMQGQGTSFYMSNSISTRSFQDLNTSIGDIATSLWWTLQKGHSICTCDFPFIHNLIVTNDARRPFNLHMQFSIHSQLHYDERCKKATQFAHAIFHSRCWHDCVYVNPF
jgi:hypothetical protein